MPNHSPKRVLADAARYANSGSTRIFDGKVFKFETGSQKKSEDEVKTLFRNEIWHVYVKKSRLGKRLVVESKTLLDHPVVHAGSQRAAFISYSHPEQIPEYVKREVRKHLMQEWKPFLRGRIGKRTVKRRE